MKDGSVASVVSARPNFLRLAAVRKKLNNPSDYLFGPTQKSVKNLLKESIFGKALDIGNLSMEIFIETIKLANNSQVIEVMELEPKKYIPFTPHGAENAKFAIFLSMINALQNIKDTRIGFPILVPRFQYSESCFWKCINILDKEIIVLGIG